MVRELQEQFYSKGTTGTVLWKELLEPLFGRELHEPFCSKGTTGTILWKGTTGAVL